MSSAETARRKRRALLILSEGYVVIPCSYYKSKSAKCVMKEGHKNCSECTRRGRTCDGKGVSVAEADRLVQAKARLEAAEEATEEELLDLQRQVNERLSKLMRLRRQKRLLQSKGMKMLERDIQAEGDLESSVVPSAVEESSSVVDSIAAGAVDLIDWNSVFVDAPSEWIDSVVGESSSEVVGH
ncbi:hypothetical protein FIE12Z_13010 [Fusarium flagelliforme]|uniref:Uncharacterized protein n=1 Tax=Fusarium flagelliforme TaxID=2675880 RepID=A0A395M4G9_9HYPO|nr:hypothetical protein FIE12Z_13010 [Fusarium flagelliforme]